MISSHSVWKKRKGEKWKKGRRKGGKREWNLWNTSLESIFYQPDWFRCLTIIELRFSLKGESTQFPCQLSQLFVRFVARKIFLLANPHPSCNAYNLFSTFSFLRTILKSYFSNMFSSQVPRTMSGYLHRLAQPLTAVLQSDYSVYSSDGKSDWSKSSQSASGQVKINLSPKTVLLFHNTLPMRLPVLPSSLTGS